MNKELLKLIDGERDGKLIRLENKSNRSERRYLGEIKRKLESLGYEIPVIAQSLLNRKIYYIIIEKKEK